MRPSQNTAACAGSVFSHFQQHETLKDIHYPDEMHGSSGVCVVGCLYCVFQWEIPVGE